MQRRSVQDPAYKLDPLFCFPFYFPTMSYSSNTYLIYEKRIEFNDVVQ